MAHPDTDHGMATALNHQRLIGGGPRAEVVSAAKQAHDAGGHGPLLIFDDRSSQPIEVDFRGTLDQMLARLPADAASTTVARGRGRPKLGVVPREVTLLPRDRDWLARQPGGASAVLRQLVEQDLRGYGARERSRLAMEAVDRFMLAMTGDFRGHEEASRAFYRGERERFTTLIEHWPTDVRDHLQRLVARAWTDQP